MKNVYYLLLAPLFLIGCASREEAKAPAPVIAQVPATIPTPTPTNEVVQSSEAPPPPAWGQQKTGASFNPRHNDDDAETISYNIHLQEIFTEAEGYTQLSLASSLSEAQMVETQVQVAYSENKKFKNVPKRYRSTHQILNRALYKMYTCAQSISRYKQGLSSEPGDIDSRMQAIRTLINLAVNEAKKADGLIPR